MNRDDVIRMAREAGSIDSDDVIETVFAAFAAHVRETEFKPDWNKYQQGLADGAAAEREACAKACEEYETENDITATWLNIVATAIRARKELK